MTRVRTRKSRRSRTRRSRMRRINRVKKQYYLGGRSRRYKNKKLRKSRKKNRKLYGGAFIKHQLVRAPTGHGTIEGAIVRKVNNDGTYNIEFVHGGERKSVNEVEMQTIPAVEMHEALGF